MVNMGGMFKSAVNALAGAATPRKIDASALVDKAPSWEKLRSELEAASTEEELSFRSKLESGRLDHACASAKRRLFDLPEGEEPRLTLYRDTASWCPYCEKVWLLSLIHI